MRRNTRLAAAMLALCAAIPLTAAEGDPGAGAALLAVSTVPPTGATASIRVQAANVRFAPHARAAHVVTLKHGAVVELIGRAPAAGWWAIRFPREGRAWVDKRNLVSEGNGTLWRVARDGIRAREDATAGSGIVRELAKGEILEDRGTETGSFRAVWIPNAVAFISESLLNFDAGAEDKLRASSMHSEAAEQEWKDAARLYLDLYREATSDLSRAPAIDWNPLVARLDRVIAMHPSANTRLQAHAIKQGVADVQRAAGNIGGQTVPAVPVKPLDNVPTPEPVAAGTAANDPKATAVKGLPTADQYVNKVVPQRAQFAARGMLEAHDYPTVGVTHHLIDADGKVVALLKPAAGATITFSEYVWREVGVNGVVGVADPAQTALPKPVSLITISELASAQ